MKNNVRIGWFHLVQAWDKGKHINLFHFKDNASTLFLKLLKT